MPARRILNQRPSGQGEHGGDVPPGAMRRDVSGFLEESVVRGAVRALKGWAFDKANPGEHVRLTVFIDGEAISDALCDVVRGDLTAAGLPRADCGFEWPVPAQFLDGQPHILMLRVGDGSVLASISPFASAPASWVAPPQPGGASQETAEGGPADVRPGAEVVPDKPPVGLARRLGAAKAARRAGALQGRAPGAAGNAGEKAGAAAGTAPGAEGQELPACPGLFDAAFYLEANPDVAASGQEPWLHFLQQGAAEGRDPNLLFSVRHYAAVNPDVAASGANPLVHYDTVGQHESRVFHWLFSVEAYRRMNPDLGPEVDALRHALAWGMQENRRPHPLFDPAFYLARYPDVAASGMPALMHFLIAGDREGRAPNALFDPAYFRQGAGTQVSDRSGKPMGALEQYVRGGGATDPHPLFDTGYYKTAYAQWDGGTIPLQHYLEVGAPDGVDPHPAFSTPYYLGQEPAGRACPLQHYVQEGRARGLSPHPLFDPGFYGAQPSRLTWDGRVLPTQGPVISVIVPVYETPADVLTACIESVRQQTYSSWELCIVDDGSRDPGTAAVLARYRGLDSRIRIDRSIANLHIARATNRAVMQATGLFIAFLDHDDVLEPEALAEVAAALEADPTIDMLYTDEDKLDENGVLRDPYHKPEWSPEHLHSVMYVLHMLVVRKSMFWAVGGSRPERTGAQDYDLALRVAGRARRVHHIPRILYHWRMLSGSAAAAVEAKPYALIAAKNALEDAVTAAGLDARVEDGLVQGTYRVRASLASRPPVTLLVFTNDSERDVPGRGRVNLVRHFIDSIVEKSSYANIRLVVVDNANSSAETKKLIKRAGGRIVSYTDKGAFSYARKANFGTRVVETEHVIYLNDDLEVISPDWIEALLEQTTNEAVGGAGGRLLYPDGRIQHSGVILGIDGATGHAFWSLGRETVGYNAYTHVIRNYSAVTGAVFATRMALMNEVGGYDERLAVDFNDVDLCLRLGQAGRRIVFTPFCELYHFEGSTAVRTTQNPAERQLFTERWAPLIARDPYYNPNLPRDRTGFA